MICCGASFGPWRWSHCLQARQQVWQSRRVELLMMRPQATQRRDSQGRQFGKGDLGTVHLRDGVGVRARGCR
jgi:hypothetical protein